MLSQIRIILSVVIIIALLLSSGLLLGERAAAAADGEGLDLPPIELPEKGNPKLDSQLNQLVSAQTPKRAGSFAQGSNIELVDGNVRVIVECLPDQVDAAVKAVGALGVVETSYRNLLQVTVSISQLATLADNPSIRLVRMPWSPLPAVVSEGVQVTSADEVHTAGYTGAGVKIAILDIGFTGYAYLLGTELPASVTTQSFYAGSDIEGYTAHGTICAEIIYDIAPGAQLYLVNFDTEAEMSNAVDWLIAQGVDVISCSIGWPTGGPGDGTGAICEMVDDAWAAGIVWSQSIGNSAQQHWQGSFVDTNADGWHEFNLGTDDTNSIWAETGDWIEVGLKWDDTWGSSGNDYDLYLFDSSSPDPVAWSINTQDGNDDPWEGFSYYAQYTGVYHIAIGRYSATDTVNFHLYSYIHDLQYQVASSSFAIPADSPNAMVVGAVPWHNPTTLESFSSRGPTKDGRIKPDLVAPDGVSTTTYGASNGVEYLSGGTGFYGTSASAPHAAGAAALLLDKNPAWNVAQVRYALESTAVNRGASGQDNLYGWGLVDAYAAVTGFNPPTIESIAAKPSSVSLAVDDEEQLIVTATYSDASTGDVTGEASYESSDTSVATVSDAGVITAVAEGSATVTVTYETETADVSVTVTVEPAILDYYRGHSGDTEVVETTDLLKAANDWANAVVPPDFTEPISTTQLLGLANEWAATEQESIEGELKVHFIDVGQGDSILVDLGEIEVLIDGGGQSPGVTAYLSNYVDGQLEVMVATHPHADHIGGLIAVLDAFDVQEIWHNGDTSTSQTYAQFMAAVQREGAEVHIASREDKILAGELTFLVLNPATLAGNTNNNSIVLRLGYGEVDFLFTGDAEREAEANMLGAGIVPNVEILKVGHHGSKTASSQDFLTVTSPEVAIYMAGESNRYGHPHEETINALDEIGAEIYGTDIHGSITITTNGETFAVQTEKR